MTAAWKRTYTNKGFTGNSSVGDSDVHPGGWLLKQQRILQSRKVFSSKTELCTQVTELRGNGLIGCLYAGSSLYIDIKFCVWTDLQNMYALVKLFFYRVSNKNMKASWNLHLALNLVAVTNKAQGLEVCKHVQEETKHTYKFCMKYFHIRNWQWQWCMLSRLYLTKGMEFEFYQFVHRKGCLNCVSSTYNFS